MAADSKLDLLRSVPLFRGLGKKEIERVGQLTDTVDLPAGRVLMRQGEIGSEMFVLVSGRVQVERDGKVLAQRGPREVVGEIALTAHVPRVATVTTLEPTRALVVSHADFHSLMDEMPTVRTAILEALASRLSSLDPDAA